MTVLTFMNAAIFKILISNCSFMTFYWIETKPKLIQLKTFKKPPFFQNLVIELEPI